jgi:hypothetical protein
MRLNQIPKMGIPTKINPKKVACFSSPNPDHQLPSSPAIHHNSTTKKPRTTTRFPQNPRKNRGATTAKKIPAKAPLVEQFLRFSEDNSYGFDERCN